MTLISIEMVTYLMRKFVFIVASIYLCAFGQFARADSNLQAAYELFRNQDYSAALPKFQISAQQGNPESQVYLAIMYSSGLGTLVDLGKAFSWMRLAAEQGHLSAQYRVGLAHLGGMGTPVDYLRAHMWINVAEMRGFKDTAHLLKGLASVMTPQQVVQAQKMASDCLAKNFKGCD